jgi:hypothetical protein
MNIRNFLDLVLENSRKVLKRGNFDGFEESLKFLVLNLFGKTLEYFREKEKDLFSCEKGSIQDLSRVKVVLISLGVAVILFCWMLSIFLIRRIQANQFFLWKNLLKITTSTSPFVIKCRQRLLDFSSSALEMNDVKVVNLKHLRKLKFYTRYFIKISILLIIGSVYLIVVYYKYYLEFESSLLQRNQMFKNLSFTKTSLTALNFWQRNLFQSPSDVFHSLDPVIPFSQDYRMIIIKEIKVLKKHLFSIKDGRSYILRTGKMFEKLFEEQNSTRFTRKGTVSGVFLWVFDGYFLRTNQMDDKELEDYFLTFADIQSEIDEVFEYFDQTSKDQIEEEVKSFIKFSCSFFVFYLGFYFFIMRPFLKKEVRCNKTVEFLAEIIDEVEKGK